ncbi:ATP-dependent DNA helicase RecG [Candidatus Curtissbacteria bacterium]|nr:ATP-dependent DNA helicase RecG [Candidatus Curtissbacteria bacterium]
MDPKTKVSDLPGVGAFYKIKLKRLAIETVEDLIYHFPFRWDDFSKVEAIRDITPGGKLSIQGVIWQIKNIRTRFGKFITTAQVADPSGVIDVIWFNQPYLTKTLKAGTPISLSGKVDTTGPRPKLMSPAWEIIRNQLPNSHPGGSIATDRISTSDSIAPSSQSSTSLQNDNAPQPTLHTGRLVPVYPETEGVSSKWLRAKIASILPQYLKTQKDFLPPDIKSRQNLLTLEDALSKIHFPKKWDDIEKARSRLAFDELFLIQLASTLRKRDWQSAKTAPQIKSNQAKIKGLVSKLPFSLTGAQVRATNQILADLSRQTPQNRLLEGDVGSGKTVVAAIAAYLAILNGFDVLFAAPTEILAFQHQQTLDAILSPLGAKVGIWTGSRKTAGDVTCGTHALLETFKPKRQVGLIIVDEQHRFGVAQRAKLFQDQTKEFTPHFLTMTATPIPRTLALTLYRDLDLSVLDEMPKGRQKIATFVVPNFKRKDAYDFIAKQIGEGRQAFIITPFVEPSETMVTVKAATEEFEKLQKIFSVIASETKQSTQRHSGVNEVNDRISNTESDSIGLKPSRMTKPVRLGLLHGRLKSKEKEKIITDFKKNKINILVTTPVVEVGIDVPNASVMMIESADRFGLAQLHQLRGRVGRGEHKSYCLLFSDSRAANSIKRLKSMEKIHVGFELAEIDLKMRGAGEIFGLKQSGFINLKIADLSDAVTLARAQREADAIIKKDPALKSYPTLAEKLSSIQNELVRPN